MSVLGVVINWRRPLNVMRIIPEAKKRVDWLVVVDNSGDPYVSFTADDVWTIRQNLGCPVRWAPALMLHRFDYVAFFDDDVMPGDVSDGVQHADVYGIVGQGGRKLRQGKYVYGDVARPGKCDVVVRNCVFRRELIRDALLMRDLVAKKAPDLADVHDDIMLNCATQLFARRSSYVGPALLGDSLPDGDALHRKPGHLADRQRIIDICKELGWRSECS